MQKIISSCYGSCGELFQGIVDGQELLISYHINQKNSVIWQVDNSTDQSLSKMIEAKQFFSNHEPLNLKRFCNLPVGKGCASSTADIISTLQIMAQLKQAHLSAEDTTRLCAKIEPTDSIAFSQWTAINPLNGEVKEHFDWEPRLYVYMLEPLDTIDTLTLPRMSESAYYDKVASQQLYQHLQQAIKTKDLAYLGDVSTQCALLNQVRLPKAYLFELIRFVHLEKLLGLNIAHSGTVVGLLLREKDVSRVDELEAKIARQSFAKYYQKRALYQIVYRGMEVNVWK
ncbi:MULTISPECIES: kinase [unclassified Granulicatella]|uniref:GHMP family kinase ATP-binding protein n=1 Tax=unclassified Granulicatella TaxID=2630493 RepID=UPI0010735DD4|nr:MULTISPECIES: kinase [unclassified Granulicatella]MBF0779546.1 kinase [Granulicatella sp. 19428wC4_WM01]TFU96510.1 kinase [Granulicatella sp. WM01]